MSWSRPRAECLSQRWWVQPMPPCRSTGFGGTTQVATAAPSRVLDRKLKVRFDANVAGGLPWRFEPEQNSIEVKVGEVVTIGYRVVNESARETVGVASYNVSPSTV